MQVFGMFVEVEERGFQRRLDAVLPVITCLLQASAEEDSDDNDDGMEEENNNAENNSKGIKSKDKLLYNTLTCLGKIFLIPELLLVNKKYVSTLAPMWGK